MHMENDRDEMKVDQMDGGDDRWDMYMKGT